MTSKILNKSPYLRETRDFPEESHALSVELNKMYNDVALAVNQRTISQFAVDQHIITGEAWFLNNRKQQTIRQVYSFTSTSAITHNINFKSITNITKMYGTYTDGSNWYGLIPGSTTGITDQIVFYLDSTKINFVSAGTPPTLSSGTIVLEWLSTI